MAYRKRKEAVEKQIKEHNESKLTKASEAKCPFGAGASAAESVPKNETDEQNNAANASNAGDLKDFKLNKKVVVSIQTNEEKLKENVLSKNLKSKFIIKTSFFLILFARLNIAPEQIHEYCKKLFEFDVIKVKKFK
jgi:hypothetical protein